jgi:hypothetical protein
VPEGRPGAEVSGVRSPNAPPRPAREKAVVAGLQPGHDAGDPQISPISTDSFFGNEKPICGIRVDSLDFNWERPVG